MLEKELEQKFVKQVRKQGGIAYKFISPNNAGVPDRLVIFDSNKIGFVELKSLGQKPRLLQIKQIERLKNLGCKVFVLDRPEDIQTVIDEIRKE